MLQINNADDVKPEWNINETHIIIPMINGDVITRDPDKISVGGITLNALETGDQTVLTNGFEHSFVIGLDKNLFESHANKSDLLVIQNSDLKLLPCNPYTLSYVDQDKSEILWESPVLKERIKPDWSDKGIFEERDVLNYDYVQESSRNCSDDLEKSNSNYLDDVGGDLSSHVAKIHGEIFIPVEDALTDDKKTDCHYIVNYYPSVQNCEEISNLPNSVITKAPPHSINKNDLIESKEPKANVDAAPEEAEDVLEQQYVPISTSNQFIHYETEVKEDLIEVALPAKGITIKGCGGTGTLPEKSLPLKKKAKMKGTLIVVNTDNQSLIKRNSVIDTHQSLLEPNPVIDTQQSLLEQNDAQQDLAKLSRRDPPGSTIQKNCDSDAPLKKKMKKSEKKPTGGRKMKSSSQSQEEGSTKLEQPPELQNSGCKERITTRAFFNLSQKKEPSCIFELVDGLRKARFINAPIWETLKSGLRELKGDILQEMNAKKAEKGRIEGSKYSAELKAFALVLYFKQPAAFNHLAKLYKNGWPSLSIIKEWKERMNNHHRPNFIAVRRETIVKPQE